MNTAHNISNDYRLDLPALRVDDRDLPIPVAGTGARHEQVSKMHPNWSTFASQRHVRGLALDLAQGELWLATGGGVLRWRQGLDGFTRYASEHGLPGNSIASVAVDGNGRVWANPEQAGLFYLDGDAWRPFLALEGVQIGCLSISRAGRLWVATENYISAVGAPQDSLHAEIHLPPGYFPRAIIVTNINDIWLCNARGLYHFDGDCWSCCQVHPGILVMAMQNQNLWLGTIDGLVRVDLADGKLHQSNAWPPGEITALAPTENGVWAACEGEIGLATDAGWAPLRGHCPCTPARITALASLGDKVWIGTHNGLLYGDHIGVHPHLTDEPPDVIGFAVPGYPPNTFSNMVQALAVQQLEDNRSIVWIGTACGLFRFDLFTESWRRYTQQGLWDVRALVGGETQEEMWAASWTGGLHNLKKRSVQALETGVPGPVLALAQGHGPVRWAAGLEGLYRSDGSAWTLAISANKLPSQGWIQSVAQAHDQRVWIGASAGLLMYEPAADTLTMVSGILGSANVRSLLAILKDENEYLWIGAERGLYGGRPGEFNLVLALDGLVATSLAWDGESLWVGTDNGLFQAAVSENELEIVCEFTVQNSGLAANRITALALGRDDVGQRLWVGTPCGLSCYNY